MSRQLGRWAFIGLLAFAMLGSHTSESEILLPINACTLLRDGAVAAILGLKVNPGEPHDTGNVESGGIGIYSSTCLWRVANKDRPTSDPKLSLGGASYAILNAMQWPPGSGQAKNFLQKFRDAAREGTIDQVPVALKIADDALWWGDGVAVCKGDRSFGISVHLVGGRTKERGMEEALAREIVAGL
jgi:hypothetical protein